MFKYTVIQHSNFLSPGLSSVLPYRYITWSSISNDEIAGARPDVNIKVSAYVKA